MSEFGKEVKSTLNGTLPVELSFGPKSIGFKILKKGPGGPVLSQKSEKIAQFIAKRVNLSYIPAVRTAKSAHEVVTELIEKELAVVETHAEFRKALAAVAELQRPVLEKISASIKKTLRVFLPSVTAVNVSIPEEERFRALRRSCEISVDDGTPTQLMRKGDGVQSLAALSLMRHASETSGAGKNLILAIEEPESHLHPSAIHQLRAVIADIAKKHQDIMTTHCPLFVDRGRIKSNIIVHNNRATPATGVKEIRDILGVRASDNLQHAELMLVVEGEADRRSFRALLNQHGGIIERSIREQSLGFESLQGGTNLSYKLSQIRETMCLAHTFLDHDSCGRTAQARAEQDGLLSMADVTFAICLGQKDSEFEDMLDSGLYAPLLQNKYGVSIESPKFRTSGKWSDRLGETFRQQGKTWSEVLEKKIKTDVAELVEANPGTALNPPKASAFNALVAALEKKLGAIEHSKA